MSWVKGDRLKITLEVIAEEPSDETGDIWFLEGIGRSYLNLPDIKLAGGEYTLEVLPKPVELPTKKWASVLLNFWGKKFPALLDETGEWLDKSGTSIPETVVRRNYVRTLSEGVDE